MVNFCGQVDVTDYVKGHSSYLKRSSDIIQALDIDGFYPTHNYKILRPAAEVEAEALAEAEALEEADSDAEP